MISHQCSPNCKLTNSLKDRNYEISLTSIREIKAGDILTVNFVEGISDDQKPIHLKQYLEFCLCGSKNCFLNPK